VKRRDVIVSPEAQSDLRWIYETVEAAVGAAAAMRYVERIGEYLRRLEYASERGTRRDEIRPGLRIVGFERRITVAFAVEPDRVNILRVFYGGVSWEDELS
jgi:toxin ParE1/3/4